MGLVGDKEQSFEHEHLYIYFYDARRLRDSSLASYKDCLDPAPYFWHFCLDKALHTGHWKFNMAPHGKELSEDLKKKNCCFT